MIVTREARQVVAPWLVPRAVGSALSRLSPSDRPQVFFFFNQKQCEKQKIP
jgi:hypothetical protein